MRRFSLGSSADRKIVVVEVTGSKLNVVRVKPDGTTTRQAKDLSSEADARSACEKLVQELVARGYFEHGGKRTPSISAEPAKAKAKSAAPIDDPDDAPPASLFDDLEPVSESIAPLARLAVPPEPACEPKKAKAAKKKKKKKTVKDPNGLDRRVLAGVGAVALVVVGIIGYVAYDTFLKPPSIIGSWGGSMVEHEISRSLTHTAYNLVLDEKKNASLTIDHQVTTTGSYTLKGNRLKLALKDDDGYSSDREFKIKLGGSTLDLIDPDSGKLIVQLLRLRAAPRRRPAARSPMPRRGPRWWTTTPASSIRPPIRRSRPSNSARRTARSSSDTPRDGRPTPVPAPTTPIRT